MLPIRGLGTIMTRRGLDSLAGESARPTPTTNEGKPTTKSPSLGNCGTASPAAQLHQSLARLLFHLFRPDTKAGS